MASSADYGESKFNLAAQGHRQPGSSFKIDGADDRAARGRRTRTRTRYTSGSPTQHRRPARTARRSTIKTYGGTSGGNMNLVAGDAALRQLGLHPARARPRARQGQARRRVDMGIKSELNGYPAESLGGLEDGVSPLEMANAYATIASGGYRNRPTAITQDRRSRDGKSELPRALARQAHEGLHGRRDLRGDQDPRGRTSRAAPAARAAIGCPAAGKTGTTDSNTDAWFVGFTPRLATAVWVGYPNDRDRDERRCSSAARSTAARSRPTSGATT